MRRALFVYLLIVGAFCIIFARLFYWQIIRGEQLRDQASLQYWSEFTLPALRGEIRTDDNQPLVMNVPAFLVYAEPKQIENPVLFARAVASVLAKDEKVILEQISNEQAYWVPLGRKVSLDVEEKLQQLQLKGLGFEKESQRYYPESSMAAQLLGFVGQDQNGLDKGYFGLEGFYDRELRGIDGKIQIQKDVKGAPILIGDAKRVEAQDGRTLLLWINKAIQNIVSERLKEGIQRYGALEGSVVVMDPKTGGILAMASYPSYDPSAYYSFDKEYYKNPVVAGSFEPGSTFKVLVMGAAINEHAVQATTVMNETGPVQIGEYQIRTWNDQYSGPQTMTQVIQHSSNVGMVFVEQKLGKDQLLKYIRQFGFGSPSGIDLEDETSPDLRKDNQWGDIDLATVSFGQGIAVTPMQMVRAVGTVANGGWLMEPHVVKNIIDNRGKVIDIKPKRSTQILSKQATDVITEMMVNAVDNGEAKWAKPKGYRIAGKTGTAQIPVSGHYDETKTIASFVGFAPADDPQFVMLVTLREPKTSPWGSETAAPLFFAIAKDIFLYKGIAPSL